MLYVTWAPTYFQIPNHFHRFKSMTCALFLEKNVASTVPLVRLG